MEKAILTIFLTAALLLVGCAIRPEDAPYLGAAAYITGQNMQQAYWNQAAINAYWSNYNLQQQQLFQMQQMNYNLQRMRRF